jgi:enoyl-CoA hydratase/carnithine racemase
MTSGKILVHIQGAIATITLNRPDKLNALDLDMLAGLEAAADELDHDPAVRVILLVAAGERAFSVGADINAWAALSPLQMGMAWVRDGHRLFDRLSRLRQPLIAVLNGYTFGGGLELALTADIRLAADHVELAFPEVKLGTVPGWGGTSRLPALIGMGRAKQMIFSGGRIDAQTAQAWGLVNEALPRDHILPRAQALAAEIAANAPVAVQLAKQIMDGGDVTFEALAAVSTAFTEDAREGLAAYRARRAPEFTGK